MLNVYMYTMLHVYSFIIHIITKGFYKDIPNDVEWWFDTYNYNENVERPLLIGMNKKVIGLFKDELGGKVMKKLCALRARTYPYWMDDGSENKKAKWIKKCVIKRGAMFVNYTDWLFNNSKDLKSSIMKFTWKNSIKLH